MIVAILLAYLSRTGQRRHYRDVFIGVGAAMVVVVVGGALAYALVRHYDGSSVQSYFETGTYLVAAGALTYMTFWMREHARTMARDLEERSALALSIGRRRGLRLLSAQAVGREGLETMVFTLAIVFASSRAGATPIGGAYLLLGGALGLALSLMVALAMYRLGAKINLRRFFQVLGVALMIFAAGLLADATENLQRLGWLPFGRSVLWNTRAFVAESSNTGDVLHSLVGYADRPTLLQVLVWVIYVAIATTAFTRRSATKSRGTRFAAIRTRRAEEKLATGCDATNRRDSSGVPLTYRAERGETTT